MSSALRIPFMSDGRRCSVTSVRAVRRSQEKDTKNLYITHCLIDHHVFDAIAIVLRDRASCI